MSEPHRALDPATLDQLYRVFREVWREYGEKQPFNLDSEGESSLRRTLASCILRAAEERELDLARIKMQALRTLQAQRSIHLQKAVVIADHSASGARRDEKKPKCQMTKEQLAAQLEHLDPGARLGVDERELAAAFEVQELGTTSVLAQVEAFAEQHRCTCSFYGYGNKPAFDKDDVF